MATKNCFSLRSAYPVLLPRCVSGRKVFHGIVLSASTPCSNTDSIFLGKQQVLIVIPHFNHPIGGELSHYQPENFWTKRFHLVKLRNTLVQTDMNKPSQQQGVGHQVQWLPRHMNAGTLGWSKMSLRLANLPPVYPARSLPGYSPRLPGNMSGNHLSADSFTLSNGSWRVPFPRASGLIRLLSTWSQILLICVWSVDTWFLFFAFLPRWLVHHLSSPGFELTAALWTESRADPWCL